MASQEVSCENEGTQYVLDPICRCLRPDQVTTSFRETHNADAKHGRFASCHRAACHQPIVLLYHGAVGACVFHDVRCFSSSQSIPAASISNANFGVFPPHHHHHHWALRMVHNEFVDELPREWSAKASIRKYCSSWPSLESSDRVWVC